MVHEEHAIVIKAVFLTVIKQCLHEGFFFDMNVIEETPHWEELWVVKSQTRVDLAHQSSCFMFRMTPWF